MNELGVKTSVVNTVLIDKVDYILRSLRDSRNNIKVLSDQIADKENAAAAILDQLNKARAEAFVNAATAIKPDGKLVNPNIDSQRAASELALDKIEGFTDALGVHREMLKAIQKAKNTVTCEHERRGDLKTEADLLKFLAGE